MQVTTKKGEGSTVEITIKESGPEMDKYRVKAVKNIVENEQFDGFKKGSDVPENVVVAKVGESHVQGEMLNLALQAIYPKALQKAEVNPVDMGEIKAITSYSPLEVTLSVEVLPEVTIDMKKAKKIKIKQDKTEVSADDIKKEMEMIEKQSTNFQEAKDGGKAEKDFQVTIDADGYDKKGGTQNEALTLRGFAFVLGGSSMIPGFEDKFMGKKAGDKVEFDITFPKDYHAEEFKGKKVFFDATILKVEQPHAPEWNEEFIQKIWGKKMKVDEFKEQLKEAMISDRETKARQVAEDKMYDELIKITKMEAGPKLIGRELENVWELQKQQIEQQGMQIEQYLEHTKMSEETFREQLKPIAERRLQAQLILAELRKNMDDVAVSDEDVEKETKKMFEAYSDNKEFLKKVEEMYAKGSPQFEELRGKLEYSKIVEGFIEKS